MNDRHKTALVSAAIWGLSACGSDPASTPPPSDAGASADRGAKSPATDGGGSRGGGTCASPIRLDAEGAASGADLVFRGSTAGLSDTLHPYEGCVERDAAEAVFSYRVPAGSGALMFTTEGSSFDTVLYVRNACSQAAGGADTACNNDSYDRAPQSTLYVTNAIEGQTIYLVVDGNSAEGSTPAGAFVLTARRVPFGGVGAPCRPVTEPPTPRCDGALLCSEGGAADGTPLCVTAAAANANCDPRGFTNLCSGETTCVTDPEPPEGAMPTSVCAPPGTRRNAPCRAAEPRCDGALACNSADPGSCVPVISLGIGCDPMGEANRCAAGLRCSALGAGGMPICNMP